MLKSDFINRIYLCLKTLLWMQQQWFNVEENPHYELSIQISKPGRRRTVIDFTYPDLNHKCSFMTWNPCIKDSLFCKVQSSVANSSFKSLWSSFHKILHLNLTLERGGTRL